MMGFLRSSSSRNLEKKKKREGINLQSDSILDQSPVLQAKKTLSFDDCTGISSPDPSSPGVSPHPSPLSAPQSPVLSSSTSHLGSASSSTSKRLTSSSSVTLSGPISPTASSPSRSNRATRVIGKLAIEEPDEVGRFKLDDDTEVKKRVDEIKALKSHLKKLISIIRRLNTDAQRYGKSNASFVDGLDKLQMAEKRFNAESVYAEALSKFAEAERSIATQVTQFHQSPAEQLISRINEFIAKDISTELKATKAKYEKARRDYDSAVDKVTSLRGKAKPDPIKLYNAERELKKYKRLYEDALEEVTYKLDDIEVKKSCDMIEWLINFLQQERDMYGECFAVVQHQEGYLEELTTWATDMRSYHQETVQKRTEDQAIMFQEEKDAIYDPLIQLLDTHSGVVAIVQRIITREGKNIPIPTKNDKLGVANMHQFLRQFYDSICQELLLAGYRDQMRELASALGLLEKAKEEVEL